MQFRKAEFDIRECDNGWSCDQTGRTYKSASHAFKAVKRRSKVSGDEVLVTTIHWHPKTKIGQLVAGVLAGDDE